MGRRRKHPDPEHVARADKANAFLPDPDDGPMRTSDDLAEMYGENFVLSATTGESMSSDGFDQVVPEEIGGPFVETSASEEFAEGLDESNPEDATSEAMPTPMRGEDGPPREGD